VGESLIPDEGLAERRNMRLFRRKQEKQPEVLMLSVAQLKRKLDLGEDVVIVDVRQPGGYLDYPYAIPGSVSMPPAQLPERYEELPRDKLIITYCT
jgi:Rhodanese-like domain